jgi:asparagine synthase (glutamine-hydrolysing)
LTSKYVFKQAMRGLVPDEIVARPKKGFGIPLGRWFQGELAPLLHDTCSTDAVRRGGLFRPEVVERLLREHREGRRDHRKKLYTLLAWQLWAARYRPF